MSSLCCRQTKFYVEQLSRNYGTLLCKSTFLGNLPMQKLWGMVVATATNRGGQVNEIYPSAIKETFDFSGIPKEVAEDFQEALICLGRSPHHDTI